jgi:hypothetical protein
VLGIEAATVKIADAAWAFFVGIVAKMTDVVPIGW